MSWRVTIPCTRAQGEAIADGEELFADSGTRRRSSSPTNRTGSKPDDWLIHAYFDDRADATRKSRELKQLGTRRAGDRASRRFDRLGDEEPAGPAADPRRPFLRPYADALRGPARGHRQFRDRRGPGIRHRPACDDRRLPCRARSAGKQRLRFSQTLPTSGRARACSRSPPSRCGRRHAASRPTSTPSPSTSRATMRRSTGCSSATARANCFWR